jgi:hypothetical protein
MAKNYIAIGDLVLVRRTNGTVEYVYKGAPAPRDAAEGEIDRLESEGFLVAVDDAAAEPAGMGLDGSTGPDGGTTDPGTQAPQRPRGNASESAWRDYHAARLTADGEDPQVARSTADGLSRDDIRALYPAE